MPGVIIILVTLALFPIIVCLTSVGLAAALGWILNRDAEVRNEGSELLDLNV